MARLVPLAATAVRIAKGLGTDHQGCVGMMGCQQIIKKRICLLLTGWMRPSIPCLKGWVSIKAADHEDNFKIPPMN